MVGAGTAIADRPSLTVRDVALVPAHPPMRVLLDARGRVPAIGPLFDTELAPTLVVTTNDAAPGAIDAWRAAGAKVEVVAPAAGGDGVDLDETLALLGREGVLQVLVEGGGTLLGACSPGDTRSDSSCTSRRSRSVRAGTPALAFPGPDTIGDAASLRARVGAPARPRRAHSTTRSRR